MKYNSLQILYYFCKKEKVHLPEKYYRQVKKLTHYESLRKYPIGFSYILNIKPLLAQIDFDDKLSVLDSINYIALASKRSLFDYEFRGISYLPLTVLDCNAVLIPEYLITRKDDNYYFIYEQ